MSETRHERPGVYSAYDASSVMSAGRAAKRIGVAALAVKGTANEAVTLTGYSAGVETFGEDNASTPGMSTLLKLLFANGASIWHKCITFATFFGKTVRLAKFLLGKLIL